MYNILYHVWQEFQTPVICDTVILFCLSFYNCIRKGGDNLDKVSIGKKIRMARERLGLTQEEFAQRIDTSAKTLSSWERGAYLVDVIMLNTIASVSGMTLNDFTDITPSGTDEPPDPNDFTGAEKQLIQKIRALRADKKKALYVFFGVREDK